MNAKKITNSDLISTSADGPFQEVRNVWRKIQLNSTTEQPAKEEQSAPPPVPDSQPATQHRTDKEATPEPTQLNPSQELTSKEIARLVDDIRVLREAVPDALSELRSIKKSTHYLFEFARFLRICFWVFIILVCVPLGLLWASCNTMPEF